MRVLIAEDDDVTRHKLQVLLNKIGYDVVSVRDGAEAWELLQDADSPAIAILDWMMPGLDGAQVCRNVRASRQASYVYILMLTVKGDLQDLVGCMEAGADDYISKPFHVDELRVRLRAGERIVRLQEKLRLQASHDHLTGVLNRGTIFEMLRRQLAETARNPHPLGIILADLDNFKTVNDRYGHVIGDEVLRKASERMGAQMRPYDAIGRYGGEEFLMVLPGCGMQTALLVAERVRCSLANEPLNSAAGSIAVTVSIGIAAAEKGESPAMGELIQTADAALYRAKQRGRNCVEGQQRKEQHQCHHG